MIKKTLSGLLVLMMTLSSLSFPVYAGDTDAWLNNWDYEIGELGFDGTYIYLNQYTGTDPDVTIYGKATVDGIEYPVCINVTYTDDDDSYATGLNCSDNIVNLIFESVDGTPVRSSRSDRLDEMFYGMENLETVNFGGNFYAEVSQARDMFHGCSRLRSVDIETLNFGSATIYSKMFSGCSSLEKVSINCTNGSNLSHMFEGCSSLTDVTLSDQSGKNIYISAMFKDCTSLKNVDLSGADLSKTTSFAGMFENCTSLESFDMSAFDMSSAEVLDSMFSGCTSLRSADLTTSWGNDTLSVMNMFSNCPALEEITISESFKPLYCHNMAYISEPTKLKVKGDMSAEFEENALPTFRSSNRYLGEIKMTAVIELEGQELKDEMFSIAVQEEREGESQYVGEAYNYAAYRNRIDQMIKIYEPGTHTFVAEERYVTDPGAETPVSVPIKEAKNYICEGGMRSWTVEILLLPDGTLTL